MLVNMKTQFTREIYFRNDTTPFSLSLPGSCLKSVFVIFVIIVQLTWASGVNVYGACLTDQNFPSKRCY